MDVNARVRTGLFVALLALSGALLVAEGDADSVSAASAGAYYYDESSLEGEALYDLMASRQAAFVWSTVNEDGSPNASVMVPGVVDRRAGVIAQSFGGGGNQTIENIKNGDLAVLTVYQHNPEAEDRLERNIGARIVIEYVSSRSQQERLLEQYQAMNERATLENTVFMRIVRVLPIG
ncbi:MAG: pyridoxamine 5'-phosphate oxidase family protein [Spirochaetales bacterium]